MSRTVELIFGSVLEGGLVTGVTSSSSLRLNLWRAHLQWYDLLVRQRQLRLLAFFSFLSVRL